MGQLEKYGLYVLVVVVFLILGVAIWGGEPPGREALATIDVEGEPSPARRDIDEGSDWVDFEDEVAGGGGSVGPEQRGPQQRRPQQRRPQPDGPGRADPPLDPSEFDDDPDQREAPGPQPPGPPDDPEPRQRIHRVASGDSFTSIAKRYYDDSNLHGVIAAANPDLDPNRLKIGTEVVVPARDEAEAGGGSSASPPAPGPGQGRVHVLRSGETFSDLAERYYGDPNRYGLLVDANPDLDPNRLPVAAEVKVPPARADQE